MKMMINSSLFDIPIINSVIEYDRTDSTNTKAKEFARRGSVHGTLFIAHCQTAGKGRMERSFSSPMDDGVYMSLLIRPDMSLPHIANITLVAALSITRSLKEVCGISPMIKWPNDIVIGGRKLVGILTEASSDFIVLGIGINVHNTSFPEPINATATSLYQETGRSFDNFELIKSVMSHFSILYDSFIKSDNIDFLVDEYNSLLAGMNNEVYIIPHEMSKANNNTYNVSTGNLSPYVCRGIDSSGNLLCEDVSGNIIYVNSGEVSLRGANGYI